MSKLIISIIASVLCELIYILVVLVGGKILNIEIGASFQTLSVCIIDTILIIILYCSIFNFISMIFSEATSSTIINVIIFIALFALEMYFGNIAHEPKYFEKETFTDANGNTTVISQNPNPNYPGDAKVGFARTMELLIPYGQAQTVFNVNESFYWGKDEDKEGIYKVLIYSAVEICIVNIGGIYIFSKKELK